jgi:hypothetical protein
LKDITELSAAIEKITSNPRSETAIYGIHPYDMDLLFKSFKSPIEDRKKAVKALDDIIHGLPVNQSDITHLRTIYCIMIDKEVAQHIEHYANILQTNTCK